MTTTTGGYVTDTAYVAEFYSEHAPTHLNFIAASGGFRPRPLNGEFTWCDYGCGNGISANVLAGCYPHAKFYGVDFLPAHIRTAETLALRGGLQNTTFLQKSFAELQANDLPPLDFAVMHGILSWIDAPTRKAVLDDAAKRLKPGGMLFTGVNAMPGWAAKLPMRNMVYSLTPDGMNSLQRAEIGLKWLIKLKNAEVKYFRDNPALAEAVDELAHLDPRYMAHEYFNEHLKAFYFAELRAEMESRGLKFAGCARMFLNIVDLAVAQPLQDEFRALGNRAELEAKRDFIRNETFRRDVWVKGDAISSEQEWLEMNQPMIFGTLDPLPKIDQAVAFGDIQLSYAGEPFATVLKAISSSALSLAHMENISALAGLSPWTRMDAARLLAAGGQVMSFAEETSPAKVTAATKLSMPAINRGLIKELGQTQPRVPLAATRAGTGIEVANIDAVLLQTRCEKGAAGAVHAAAETITAGKGEVVIGGKALKPRDVEKILADRSVVLEREYLSKWAEIGVVDIES